MPQQLPEEIARFIAECIDSVPELETLLLLWETAPKAWSVEELAARIYLPKDRVTAILLALIKRRLAGQVDNRGYVFRAADPEAQVVARLAAVYRSELLQVAGMIHSKASSGVLEFARAFHIKKES